MNDKLAEKNRAIWKRTSNDLFVLQFILLALLIILIIVTDLKRIATSDLIDISMNCIAIPVLSLMMLSCLRSHLMDKTVYLFVRMIFVTTVYLFLDSVALIFEGIADFCRLGMPRHHLFGRQD